VSSDTFEFYHNRPNWYDVTELETSKDESSISHRAPYFFNKDEKSSSLPTKMVSTSPLLNFIFSFFCGLFQNMVQELDVRRNH
jgi:hypothetical protein